MALGEDRITDWGCFRGGVRILVGSPQTAKTGARAKQQGDDKQKTSFL